MKETEFYTKFRQFSESLGNHCSLTVSDDNHSLVIQAANRTVKIKAGHTIMRDSQAPLPCLMDEFFPFISCEGIDVESVEPLTTALKQGNTEKALAIVAQNLDITLLKPRSSAPIV